MYYRARSHPVLVDSKNSYNTDLEQIKRRVTKNTRLIQLTHAAGESVDIRPIINFAKKNKIHVLEDCITIELKYIIKMSEHLVMLLLFQPCIEKI